MTPLSSVLAGFFYLQYYFTLGVTITINVLYRIVSLFFKCEVKNINPYHNTHKAVFMPVQQFIKMEGYSLQEYHFTTQDQASLHLWRIQKQPKQQKQQEKPYPIVLLHGLLENSSIWFLTQHKPNCLPYLLAEQGYDVWVADNRGNRISHKSQEYQNYTIDHLVQFDQPTIINGVLAATNKEKLIFIGHSQGSTQLLLALGVHSQLRDKIAAFIGLGTVISFKGVTENKILNMLSKGYIFEILNWMGFERLIILSQRMLRAIGVTMFNSYIHFWMVLRGFKELIGVNGKTIPKDMIGVVFTHGPGGGSVNNVLHWIQCFRNRDHFSKFCYGKQKNKVKYGREDAPKYCLKHLKALQFNAYFFRGGKDALTSQQDFANLANFFVEEKVSTFELEEYNHLDYLWGEKVHQDIYDEIVKIVNSNP